VVRQGLPIGGKRRAHLPPRPTLLLTPPFADPYAQNQLVGCSSVDILRCRSASPGRGNRVTSHSNECGARWLQLVAVEPVGYVDDLKVPIVTAGLRGTLFPLETVFL
jgi:hypothetical protein